MEGGGGSGKTDGRMIKEGGNQGRERVEGSRNGEGR